MDFNLVNYWYQLELQTLSLHTQMTVKENITFYGYLFGMHFEELKNRVNEYVTFLELPDKHRFVGELR